MNFREKKKLFLLNEAQKSSKYHQQNVTVDFSMVNINLLTHSYTGWCACDDILNGEKSGPNITYERKLIDTIGSKLCLNKTCRQIACRHK